MPQILLQNETAILLQNATEIYYKMRQVFYYKMRQFYYKMRQLLQIATILLQNATFIINCNNTYCYRLIFPNGCTVREMGSPMYHSYLTIMEKYGFQLKFFVAIFRKIEEIDI